MAILIGGTGVLSLVCATALVLFTSWLNNLGNSIKNAAESIDAAHEIEANVLNYGRESLLFGLNNDPLHARKRDFSAQQALEFLKRVERHANTAEEIQVVERLRSSMPAYFKHLHDLEAHGRTPIEVAELVFREVDEIVTDAEKLIQLNLEDSVRTSDLGAKMNTVADIVAFVAMLSLGVGVPLTFFAVRSQLYKPLLNIINSLKTFRAGQVYLPEQSGIAELRETSETISMIMRDLEQSRAHQMRYLAAVAHDIKNPIGAIKMAADLGLQEASGEEVTEYFEVISRQSKYLDHMVGDFIDTTRVEGGWLQLSPTTQDLRELVTGSARLFQNYSRLHVLTCECPDTPLICEVDAVRVSQVLNNLISNAIKYSPNGGFVRIKLENSSNGVLISVQDDGIGISPKELDEIFVPFRRSQMTRETIPGVGLGLFTAKRIIEAHNGRLTVESVAGKGSTFTVHLPYDAGSVHFVQKRQGAVAASLQSDV